MEVVKPITEGFLQNGILLLAGTVTGVIPDGEFLKLVYRFGKFPATGLHADEVETAEEHIRPEPAEDIQQTLVGTAAEAVFSALFFQQEILLMEVIVVGVNTVFPDRLPENSKSEGSEQIIAGTKSDALCNFQHIIDENQPGIILP